ncbi:RHS repeat-associated core domain-containing protein [Moritella sp. 28]|uniref:RHS repeat-associated core domain-containing protein n=1 Tax=Moritella sp. 28 TaxID=2746232 RepID=UPI001BAB323A|nr:RHS repeat-associated core domain-containing protein [Moritella sp. 28]QUM86839.1 hypothetical protein HWV02_21285 [Moritella sp. 28]
MKFRNKTQKILINNSELKILKKKNLSFLPKLSRRQFLIRASILSSVVSFSTLPTSVKAAADLLREDKQLKIIINSIGFNGERIDPITKLYHLGQGYRVYNPALMRFNQADELSPFGDGGINPYAYCLGDPINFIDPTGRSADLWGIIGGVLGLIMCTLVTIASFGSLAGATAPGFAGAVMGIVGGAAGMVSSTLAIGGASISDDNPHKKNLGYASTAFGIASAVSFSASTINAFATTTRAAVGVAKSGASATKIAKSVGSSVKSGISAVAYTGDAVVSMLGAAEQANPDFNVSNKTKYWSMATTGVKIATNISRLPDQTGGSSRGYTIRNNDVAPHAKTLLAARTNWGAANGCEMFRAVYFAGTLTNEFL